VRTPEEYRSEAETYVRRAEAAKTNAQGQRYLQMAQSCLRLADLADLVGSVEHTAQPTHPPPVYTGL
jgi:hypothetical protein